MKNYLSTITSIKPSYNTLIISFVLVLLMTVSKNSFSQCNGTLPVAICHQELAISINNKGMALVPARFFDNGSHDTTGGTNCPIWFKIKRMTTDSMCYSPDNPNQEFHDNLKLCCSDVGDTLIVILRVYDLEPDAGPVPDDTLMGNFNDCMIRVFTIDKIAPTIICPPDTTIECGFLHGDLSLLGMPIIEDNCDSILLEIKIDSQLNICGTGKLLRKFIVSDGSGLKDSCVQIITIENNFPFDGNDPDQLMWPPDTMVFDCKAAVDTSITGYPKIIEDECDLVGVDFEDEIFEFSKNGACYKIIRKWIVIDWCQHVPGLRNPYTADNGYWSHEQFIKVLDTIAPIVTGARDTTVLNYSNNCEPIQITLPVATADDCDNKDPIEFSVEIDYNNDGSIDTIISGNDASGLYPNGIHKLNFLAKDRCGNVGVLSVLLTVVDGKLPSPVSKNGIVVVLTQMANGVMTMLDARLLNASSYDNCTPSDCLKFSFSQDVNDTIKVFNCDSLCDNSDGKVEVEFWVTDKAGNQDFAKTFVRVEDNQSLCPACVHTTTVSGRVITNTIGLGKVNMTLHSQQLSMSVMSDDVGYYMFDNVHMGNTYELKPSKTTNPKQGLSTRDLILIQKHLLGYSSITTPFGIIAADVNMSGDISTRDISALRKVILGKVKTFSHHQSWRFILAGYQFPEPDNPLLFGFPESFMMHNVRDVMEIGFDAIKIGDVDGSASLNMVGTRGQNDQLSMSWIKSVTNQGSVEWNLTLDREIELEGLEMTIALPSNIKSAHLEAMNLPLFNEANYEFNTTNNSLKISWSDLEGVTLYKDQRILKLTSEIVKNTQFGFDINLSPMSGFAFVKDGDELDLVYNSLDNKTTEPSLGEIQLFQNAPNPFHQETIIEFYIPTASNVRLSIRNSIGESMYSQERNIEAGSSQWMINETSQWPSGMYLYTIEVNGEKITNRMIYMKD